MNLSLIFKNNKQIFLLTLGFIIYVSYFTLASFLRYDNFYTGRFDLGNMGQAVWNTIHGRIFEASDTTGTIISRLSSHADFLLILLSPFYLIWEHPKMLLLIQTLVLGVGAFFVFAISQHILKNKNFSLLFGIAHLLNPAVQYTNLYDFHTVTLATTFLLAAFYFLLKNKYIFLIVFLILSGLAKEQVWLIVAIFGIYILLKKEKFYKKFGISIFIVGTFLFYYLIWHAIPNVSGKQHFALSYYSDFGDSPTQIVKNFFLSPEKIITTMFTGNRLAYLQQLLYPLGLFSLFSPFFLIFALPDLFINLLSNNSQLHQIYYQYSATITSFIFISAIYGVKNLKRWFPKIPKLAYALYLIITILYFTYTFGPLPMSKNPNINMFTKPQKNKIIIENFLSSIPKEYNVAATNNLGSHLSHRQKISTVPEGIPNADIVLFLLNDSFAQPSLEDQGKMVEGLRNNKNYKVVFQKDNFMVFEKNNLQTWFK